MHFTQDAIDGLEQESSSQSSNINSATTAVSGSSNSAINSNVHSDNPTSTSIPESSAIFQALKGYKLFRHHTKLEAIVAFLRLSSLDPIFTSGDHTNIVKMDAMCEGPKLLLKGIDHAGSKYPSQWNSKFCARFICDAAELIKGDMKISASKSARKTSPRKTRTKSLPPAAATLVTMFNEAELKAQNSRTTSTRKQPSKVKTVRDLLLKTTVHNPEFVEVTSEQIMENLLCPICNHRSLVSLTTKKEAELANEIIQENFGRKINEWNAKGRAGQRPRMGKTESQVLGCVCYMQNCIGNSDGSGCFKCKKDNNTNECINR